MNLLENILWAVLEAALLVVVACFVLTYFDDWHDRFK